MTGYRPGTIILSAAVPGVNLLDFGREQLVLHLLQTIAPPIGMSNDAVGMEYAYFV